MLEFLLGRAKLQWKDILDSPNLLQERSQGLNFGHELGTDYQDYQFEWLKRSTAGRCTSVAVQLADRLRVYGHEFEFFDMDGHRLARCKDTGLVIDSSSKSGPVVVLDNEEIVRQQPRETMWSYKLRADGSGVCETSSENRHHRKTFKSSDKILSAEESMAVCLHQLAEGLPLEPLCYFRSTIHNAATVKITYHGMLRWSFGESQVQLNLIPHIWEQDDPKKTMRVIWEDHGESDAKNLEPARGYGWLLFNFIYTCGGPHAARQWDQCNEVFEHIWDAACKRWSYPRVEGNLLWNKVPFKHLSLFDDKIDDQKYFECRTILNNSRRATGHAFYARPTPPGFPEYRWLPEFRPLSYEEEIIPNDYKEAQRLEFWRQQMSMSGGTDKCSTCVELLDRNNETRVRNSAVKAH